MSAQRVGNTKHFFYEYDDALGVPAQTLALALMATCELDLFRLAEYLPFQLGGGGDIFALRPVIVRVQDAPLPSDPNTKKGPPRNGADNFGDPTKSTQSDLIRINPFDLSGNLLSPDAMRLRFCAEMDEQLMYAYNWHPGDGQGEAVSRWLAYLFYPAVAFVDVNDWLLQDPRPDWVNNLKPSDTDDISYGCGLIFLNYIVSQLQLSMPDFLQAGGNTMADRYHNLTKATDDPFVTMNNLLLKHYGKVVQLATNNPFPLYDAKDRKVLFSYTKSATSHLGAPGIAHVAPFFNCPAKDYNYNQVIRTVTQSVTASTVGFGVPDFVWKIQGLKQLASSSTGVVTVPMAIPDPNHPIVPKQTTGDMTFSYTRNESGALNSKTSTLTVTNTDFNGDYTVDISCDVTEQQEGSVNPVTADQGLDFDALGIQYEPRYYSDQAACEKAFENAISHLPRLQREIQIIKTLPDPPSERTLGRVLEAAQAIRGLVADVAKTNRAQADQIAEFAAVTLGVPRTVFVDAKAVSTIA